MSPRWGMLGASLRALGVLGPDPVLVRLAELADKLKLAGVRPRDIGAVGGESLDSATKVCERVLDAHRRRCAAHPGYEAEARTRLRRHKMARRAWHVMAGARAIKPRPRPIEADEWPIEAARMCMRAQLQGQYRFMRQVASDLDPRAQLRQLLAEGDAERHHFSWAPVPDADGNITLAEFERQYAEHLAQQRKASASIEVVGGDPRVLDRLGLAPAQPAVRLQWDSPDTFEVAPPKRITINLRQPATPPTPEEEAENAAWARQALKDKADHERYRREEIKERRRERRAGVVDLGPDEDGLRMFEPAEPAAKARQREHRAGAKRRRGWA